MRSRLVLAALLLAAAGMAAAGIQQMLLANKAATGAGEAQLPASSVDLVGISSTLGDTTVDISMSTGGLIQVVADTSGGLPDSDWLVSGVVSDFEVNLSGSGDAMSPTHDAVNTWLSMSSPRHWGYEAGSVLNPNPGSFTGTLSIRRAVGHTVLATMSVEMYSELTP